MTDANSARQFWSAAYYYRRALDRDRTKAIEVLDFLRTTAPGIVQFRAAVMMKEIEHESDSPRDG